MGVQDGHVLDDQVPHGLTGVGHQGAQKDLESHPLVDPFDYLGNPGPFRRGVHSHLMGVDPWQGGQVIDHMRVGDRGCGIIPADVGSIPHRLVDGRGDESDRAVILGHIAEISVIAGASSMEEGQGWQACGPVDGLPGADPPALGIDRIAQGHADSLFCPLR